MGMSIRARTPEDNCRTCGADVAQAGDGWDGECGDCADDTCCVEAASIEVERKKADDTEGGSCD